MIRTLTARGTGVRNTDSRRDRWRLRIPHFLGSIAADERWKAGKGFGLNSRLQNIPQFLILGLHEFKIWRTEKTARGSE